MEVDTIRDLIETLSCDYMMASPDEPESLSGLLPVLKKIHDRCRRQALKNEAEQMLKARKIITDILNQTGNEEEKIAALGDVISATLQLLETTDPSTDPEPGTPDAPVPDPESVQDMFAGIEQHLNELTLLIGSFCPGEIPDIGTMLNDLDDLILVSENIDPPAFHDIATACRIYVENITLENIHNTRPIEESIVLLKSMLSHLRRSEPFAFDYSDVLDLLKIQFEKGQMPVTQDSVDDSETEEPKIIPESAPEKISPDDLEILVDFVSEAVDNLDTIEISLIDLEQDPTNNEIINDIFRPFHTIKGVSGFLSLTKINKLAHATENLLDSARSGDFVIDHTATDAILESVDTLKTLIEKIRKGIQSGFKQSDDDIDINPLLDKLKSLQMSLSRGGKEPLGEILVRRKVVDKDSVDRALEVQKTFPGKRIGEILVDDINVAPGQVASALMEQTSIQKRVDTQVKVSTQKLDDLVDYAGELVIAQSMLRQKASNDPSLSQSVAHLGQIVTNMQNIAMSMRMIPIKATFMKMIRLVRDLSRKSGKDVALQMSGEDTEIDRNVVDALYEPMVHMIRNSVDHGIETANDRQALGKPVQGTIFLRAYHKGGHIIIEIEDDGKGLDRDRILEKAISTGRITGNEVMTDAQIYDLIMAPGFSTAREITDVSGRGVGMDVVKDGIEKFRGNLNIASQKGKGTIFTISLPLTLAIIDGMLVRVNDEKYVIPTTAVQKAFKLGPKDYFTVESKGEMVKDRGDLIPLIRLNEIYSSNSSNQSVHEGLVVVVESKNEKRALLIDELLGKDEYVIKNLGGTLEDVGGIAGGAILSDGRVGLILDIHGIFSIASGR